MQNIPVFLACDDNFAQHAGVTFQSVLENKSDDVLINGYILHAGLTKLNVSKLKKIFSGYKNSELKFIHVGEAFGSAQELKKITKAMYYRLLIPELVLELDKAIYLDCDIIVNSCLSELYCIDLEDNYIAAVQSPGSTLNRYCPSPVTGESINFAGYLKKLGMKEDAITYFYINSGMLVFNCKKYREDKLLEKVEKLVANAEFLFAPDQDAISIVTQDKKRILSLNWNYQTTLLNWKDAVLVKDWMIGNRNYYNDLIKYEKELPSIVHFVHAKPWEPLDKKSQYNYLYWQYLEKTPWKSFKYTYVLRYLKAMPKILTKQNVLTKKKVLRIIKAIPLLGSFLLFIKRNALCKR